MLNKETHSNYLFPDEYGNGVGWKTFPIRFIFLFQGEGGSSFRLSCKDLARYSSCFNRESSSSQQILFQVLPNSISAKG